MLKGKRVFIRAAQHEDFEEIHRHWSVDEINFYSITCSFPRTRAKLEEIMLGFGSQPGNFYWTICNEEQKPIGNLAMYGIDNYVREGNIGFNFFPPYRGKGYGVDAVVTALHFAFGDMNLQRMTGETLSLNTPAQKLLEKIGFIKEGCLRQAWRYRDGNYDKLIYGILKDEFQAKYPRPMILPF